MNDTKSSRAENLGALWFRIDRGGGFRWFLQCDDARAEALLLPAVRAAAEALESELQRLVRSW